MAGAPANWTKQNSQAADWDKPASPNPASFDDKANQPATWVKNPGFAADAPTYDDITLDYDDADTFYDGYDPSAGDPSDAIGKKVNYTLKEKGSDASWQ